MKPRKPEKISVGGIGGRSTSLYLLILVMLFDYSNSWMSFQPPFRNMGRFHLIDRSQDSVSAVVLNSEASNNDDTGDNEAEADQPVFKSTYNLGVGKNRPVTRVDDDSNSTIRGEDGTSTIHWYAPQPIAKPNVEIPKKAYATVPSNAETRRRLVEKSDDAKVLKGALWDEDHFDRDASETVALEEQQKELSEEVDEESDGPRRPALFYPDIDLSIPDTVYSDSVDVVWDLMRWEAFHEAQREPLLVSFLHSTILNHDTLESSLAFMLANRLASPAMMSTQIQSLVSEALAKDPSIGQSLRADIMAVRDRDPACTCLPDVFLYFKGFHALQTYRVASVLWRAGKHVLAHFLQSQVSQTFQIDIHPNATLGSGIMVSLVFFFDGIPKKKSV